MIKKDIFDHDVKAQFKAAAKDKVYRFFLADKMIKGAIIHSTRMVNEMRANHELGPLETLVLGQGYIAAGLLSTGLKDKNDKVSISIQCSGPIKGMDVESNVFGEVRGFLKTRQIEIEDPAKIKYLSTLYGAGFLTVTKYLENAPTPYSGQVALEHGSVAEDLANYFLISEQIPTGFKLSIHFDEKENVKGAGGIFLQALPGADPDKVIEAEKIIQGMDTLGKMFETGLEPEQIIGEQFAGLNPKMLSDQRIEFFCRCSSERMQGYLKGLSAEDREDIAKNGPFPLEIRCHHCNSVYRYTKQDIRSFLI